MKKISQNTFGKGLNMDLNPISTPKDVLTDCLNGTIITYNGDEFSLQTDLGNARIQVKGDEGALPAGFIPLGVKEFNNILYIVAHNPITKESRIGSFPSPQRYLPITSAFKDNQTSLVLTTNDNTSIQGLTNTLSTPAQISHGMNLLSSFLNKGDGYKVSIKIGTGREWLGDKGVNDILQKFINNYGTMGTGYFDLKYYSLNGEGVLSELPINITPGAGISDVEYVPSPFVGGTNGVLKVQSNEGASTILAMLIPKTIDKFNFKLQGHNIGNTLRAKVVFKSELIEEASSAIKVHTIKIVTTNTEFAGTTTNYYNYSTQGPGEVTIEKLVDGGAESFTEGTIITTTCTPIDQFGRELLDKVTTQTYSVTSLLLGVSGHNLFKYKIEGSNLVLDYNFLNTKANITTTGVEFYDFYSGVSKLVAAEVFTNVTDRVRTITVPLTDQPKNEIFDSVQKGGIPYTSLNLSASSEHILGTHKTTLPLRTNHCYLVRIYGTEDSIDYSVFQLLYTLPIPKFTSSYVGTSNFGTLDIIEDLAGKSLLSITSGRLFTETSIVSSPTPVMEAETSNYSRIGASSLEAYRLYGGPVFEEEQSGNIATWAGGEEFYRNPYDHFFNKKVDIQQQGYHNFPESAIGTLLPGNSVAGTDLPVDLFVNQSSNYLKGGLFADSTYSQRDFRFSLKAHLKATAPTLDGTISIDTKDGAGPLLFGNIDMAILTKRLKLGTYTSEATVHLDQSYVLDARSIVDNLAWSVTPTKADFPVHSASIRGQIVSGEKNDTIYIKDFEIHTQRFTYGNSGFKYFRKTYARNKLFNYFSLSHTQTIKARVLLSTDFSDLTKHKGFLFSGSIDPNYDVEIVLEGIYAGVSSKYSLIKNSLFNATLQWTYAPVNFDIPELLGSMGSTTSNIPLNTTDAINFNAGRESSNELVFFSYPGANSIEQSVYKTFKSTKPSRAKVFVSDAGSDLSTFNNLWRWSDVDEHYIAVQDAVSKDYLNNMILYQGYQEIIIAQYPKENFIRNNPSASSITLTGNELKYYTNSTQSTNERHLTKSCFGTAALEPFNISKFASIISNWASKNSTTVKVVYDFTNINTSEGLAKNIPWNFTNNLISTVPIADLTLSLNASSPDAHVTLFANMGAALQNSKYITSEDIGTTPVIKVLQNKVAVPVTTNFFKTESVGANENINKSTNLVIPIFNKEALVGKYSEILSGSYGVKYKLLSPPSLSNIQGSFDNVNIGDMREGGVVFSLTIVNGKITGGLVAASNKDTVEPYFPVEKFYQSLAANMRPYNTGATSLTDGAANTKILQSHIGAKNEAVSVCTSKTWGGKSGWYLPSKEELYLLLMTTRVHGDIDFKQNKAYWSSTEKDLGDAWLVWFDTMPRSNYYAKNNLRYVHPIRKF